MRMEAPKEGNIKPNLPASSGAGFKIQKLLEILKKDGVLE